MSTAADSLFTRIAQRPTLGASSHRMRSGVSCPLLTDTLLTWPEDPDTSIMHPVILPLTTTTTPLTLVGLGVRTVSFLSVRVYSAAFYLEQRLVGHLDSIAGFSVCHSSASIS